MVKVYRDEPEFAGGPVTATIPEETLNEAKDNGWKVVEEKKFEKPVEKVETQKVEEPKVEDKPKTKKKLD